MTTPIIIASPGTTTRPSAVTGSTKEKIMKIQSRWLGILAFLALAMLAGCGGGGD